MSFRGNNEEVKNNELHDMKEKGYFKAGATAGKLSLSDKGLEFFERLVKELPGKHQALVRMAADEDAEFTEAEIKAFMQQ